MAREWMDLPKAVTLTTAFGIVEVTAIDGDRFMIDANGNGKHVTVSGRDYTANMQAVVGPDGVFGRSPGSHEPEGLYCLKRHWTKYNEANATKTVRVKIREEFLRVVNVHASTPEGKAALKLAGKAQRNNEAQRVESEIKALEASLSTAKAKLAAVLARE